MPNMQIAQKDGGWSVLHEGEAVTIDGRTIYADREDLEAQIGRRGLFIHSDDSLHQTPDIPALSDPEPTYAPPTAPPTEDPPVDPNAQPDDPDPNPTVPVKEPKTKKPKKASGRAVVASSLAGTETQPRRRGRPPKTEGKLSEEEKRKARAEYAKKYRSRMTDEQREAAKERAKERQKRWREAHPDQAAQYARQSSQRRKERYNEDDEFRSTYREKQKEYAATRTKDLTT